MLALIFLEINVSLTQSQLMGCHIAGCGSEGWPPTILQKTLPRHAQITTASDNLVLLLAFPRGLASKVQQTCFLTDRRRRIRQVTVALKPVAQGRWSSLVQEDIPPRTRITLISKPPLSHGSPTHGETSGVNPNAKSGDGVPNKIVIW